MTVHPSFKRVKNKVVTEVAEPATSVMNVVLVAGVASGIAAGVLYIFRRARGKI